jgi:hypothetical protein
MKLSKILLCSAMLLLALGSTSAQADCTNGNNNCVKVSKGEDPCIQGQCNGPFRPPFDRDLLIKQSQEHLKLDAGKFTKNLDVVNAVITSEASNTHVRQ